MIKATNSSEEGRIIIKRAAFKNMITHVLKYGNDKLEINEKVMGICLGKVNEKGKEVTINKAIPITHGTGVEKEFSQEILSMFSEIDNKYPDETIQGWYTSCSGDGLDFSDADIANQRIFQTKKTPHGFCIVFKHALMGKNGNFGFEIYRLNDYKKEKYHKVAHEIELPSTLDYFKWVQRFIEEGQKESPTLIEEFVDLRSSVPKDLKTIPTSPGELIWEKELEELNPIISGFREGTEKFADSFLNTFRSQLGNWTNDLNQAVLKNAEFTRDSINQTNETIHLGMKKVINWFDKNLNDIVSSYKVSITEHLNGRINKQNEFASNLSKNVKEEIIKESIKLVENSVNSIVDEIKKNVNSTMQKLHVSSQVNLKLEELITENSNNIVSFSNELNSCIKNIVEGVESLSSSTGQDITNEFENLSSKLNSIKESHSKMDEMLQEFKDLV